MKGVAPRKTQRKILLQVSHCLGRDAVSAAASALYRSTARTARADALQTHKNGTTPAVVRVKAPAVDRCCGGEFGSGTCSSVWRLAEHLAMMAYPEAGQPSRRRLSATFVARGCRLAVSISTRSFLATSCMRQHHTVVTSWTVK